MVQRASVRVELLQSHPGPGRPNNTREGSVRKDQPPRALRIPVMWRDRDEIGARARRTRRVACRKGRLRHRAGGVVVRVHAEAAGTEEEELRVPSGAAHRGRREHGRTRDLDLEHVGGGVRAGAHDRSEGPGAHGCLRRAGKIPRIANLRPRLAARRWRKSHDGGEGERHRNDRAESLTALEIGPFHWPSRIGNRLGAHARAVRCVVVPGSARSDWQARTRAAPAIVARACSSHLLAGPRVRHSFGISVRTAARSPVVSPPSGACVAPTWSHNLLANASGFRHRGREVHDAPGRKPRTPRR